MSYTQMSGSHIGDKSAEEWPSARNPVNRRTGTDRFGKHVRAVRHAIALSITTACAPVGRRPHATS